MKKILNDLLTSGHFFTGSDNLQRFRFSLLNSLLIIASIFTLINYLSSIYQIIQFESIYEKTLLFYLCSCLFAFFILRTNKNYYLISVNIIVLSSLVLFYTALFFVLRDEFRLIWFFLVVFASFVLIGKKYGATLMLLVLASIILINNFIDLGFSSLAQFTFFNSFLIFTAFSYFFLEKIEKDSLEFKLINSKLEEKVNDEIQRQKEQEEMLLRQSRMANMGEMLDSIAHQWRQPLMHINSILMNMDNSLEAYNVKKQDRNYLENKIDEVAILTSHMSQTIEDFRNLFKLEKEKSNFTLESVISDVLWLMKNGLSNIEVEYKARGNDSIYAYKSEMIQLIIIILSNAVDALNNRSIENKKITIETYISDDSIEITIEDSAGGIPTESIDAIFNPYFTTKEQSGGTGLGLYIAKIIVEQKMNGQINVSNTLAGAKFSIML